MTDEAPDAGTDLQRARDTEGVAERQEGTDRAQTDRAAIRSSGFDPATDMDTSDMDASGIDASGTDASGTDTAVEADGAGPTRGDGPLRVAVVNDYEVIVRGVAGMLAPFADRVTVVATEVGGLPDEPSDIALFDTFGGHRTILGRAREMVADRDVGRVVLYTWSADVDLLAIARASGVAGVLSKACGAEELVDGLERIAAGERVGLDAPLRLAGHHAGGGGSLTPQFDLHANLTAREQEVLAMLGLGLSNRDIANELFLGVETVRTYVRQVYQKLGVKNRTQAAVRARVLGLEPATERRSAAAS